MSINIDIDPYFLMIRFLRLTTLLPFLLLVIFLYLLPPATDSLSINNFDTAIFKCDGLSFSDLVPGSGGGLSITPTEKKNENSRRLV